MAKHRKGQKAASAGGTQRVSHSPPARAPNLSAPLTIVLLVLTFFGIVLTSYLSYVASVETHPAFCSEGSGCDLVQSSRWATFLGMPMATWGLFTYLVLAGTGVASQDETQELDSPALRRGRRVRHQCLPDRDLDRGNRSDLFLLSRLIRHHHGDHDPDLRAATARLGNVVERSERGRRAHHRRAPYALQRGVRRSGRSRGSTASGLGHSPYRHGSQVFTAPIGVPAARSKKPCSRRPRIGCLTLNASPAVAAAHSPRRAWQTTFAVIQPGSSTTNATPAYNPLEHSPVPPASHGKSNNEA